MDLYIGESLWYVEARSKLAVMRTPAIIRRRLDHGLYEIERETGNRHGVRYMIDDVVFGSRLERPDGETCPIYWHSRGGAPALVGEEVS